MSCNTSIIIVDFNYQQKTEAGMKTKEVIVLEISILKSKRPYLLNIPVMI
jgi:hypothetical protein